MNKANPTNFSKWGGIIRVGFYILPGNPNFPMIEVLFIINSTHIIQNLSDVHMFFERKTQDELGIKKFEKSAETALREVGFSQDWEHFVGISSKSKKGNLI